MRPDRRPRQDDKNTGNTGRERRGGVDDEDVDRELQGGEDGGIENEGGRGGGQRRENDRGRTGGGGGGGGRQR